MSASSRAHPLASRASATARFEDTVDLPTPPLPDPIAMMLRTPAGRIGPACGVGWPPILRLGGSAPGAGRGGPCAAGPWAVRRTAALSTPGSLPIQKLLAGQPHGAHPLRGFGAFGLEHETDLAAVHAQRADHVAGDHKSPPSGRVRPLSACRMLSRVWLMSGLGLVVCVTRRARHRASAGGHAPPE